MVWLIFALLSAIFKSLHNFTTKKFLANVDKYILASGSFLITSILLLLFSFYRGIPQIGNQFYLAVLATTILNIVIVSLSFQALKITDLSLASPLASFTPLFLILTSFIILKELPTKYGFIGIMLIVVGSYFLNYEKRKNLFYPLKQLFKNKGTFYLFIAAFIASISSSFDKLVVLNSDSSFGSFVVYFLLSMIFLFISIIKNKDFKKIYKLNFNKFLIIGFFIFLGALTVNTAFSMQKASYVISINRLSILLEVLYGGILLKESKIFYRLIGAVIMVAGVITISLLG